MRAPRRWCVCWAAALLVATFVFRRALNAHPAPLPVPRSYSLAFGPSISTGVVGNIDYAAVSAPAVAAGAHCCDAQP